MARWYNVELEREDAERFKGLLRQLGIRYEPSECYNLIHIEVYIESDADYQACEDFLCTL